MELRDARGRAATASTRRQYAALGALLAHLAEPEARRARGRGRCLLAARGGRPRAAARVDRDRHREQGQAVRGASTITQQLAKNLYLSPSRDPLRKLRELIIARRLEAALSKARIFEIYLNVIEWGDGIWGAEAAARTLLRRRRPSALSREQAALLAGAIINPRVLQSGASERATAAPAADHPGAHGRRDDRRRRCRSSISQPRRATPRPKSRRRRDRRRRARRTTYGCPNPQSQLHRRPVPTPSLSPRPAVPPQP